MQSALKVAYPLAIRYMPLCLLRWSQTQSVEALYAAGRSQGRHMTLRAFPLLFRDTVQLCQQLYDSRLQCHSDPSLMKRGSMARIVSWML